MFQLVRQMTSFYQHFHVGKTGCFHWWINLSHKWPFLSNIFMLANSAVCGTFVVIPDSSQFGLYFHKWYFTPCSSLWRFHQIRSSTPEQSFTPKTTFCNNLCYTTHAFLVNSPIYRMFQLVPQTTQIYQHFHVGKTGCFHWWWSYP